MKRYTSGDARGVAVSGGYAYVADSSAGLQVIAVTNPTAPVRVGGCDISGLAVDVAVSGDYAYVVGWHGGLHVIDIRNPAAPTRVGGHVTVASSAWGVAVSGGYAYVADGAGGLQIFAVTNPAVPVPVYRYSTGGTANGVAVVDNHIYVADDQKGLLVLCSLPNMQSMIRVEDATLGTPCVIEASPVLGSAAQWTPLYTNASPSGPFEFTDFDVPLSQYPQKYYRARQP